MVERRKRATDIHTKTNKQSMRRRMKGLLGLASSKTTTIKCEWLKEVESMDY
jgi:hypothetical protein